MILKSGAVWDESKQLFTNIDPKGKIKVKDLKYQFSSGAEVAFSHFERADNTKDWQGSQISSCVMEELCQFEEGQFDYILSRLRTSANMKPNMRATMNPEADSWVKKYVSWYLYPEGHELFGRPDPSKQGIIRWFIRRSDGLVWGDSKEELLEKHPDGIPLAFRFISASVFDNPYIQPSYIAFLNGLPKLEKEKLLYGNWEARVEATTYFQRSWCEEITAYDPSEITKLVRAWDFAATLKSDAVPSPDYTVSVLMAKTKTNDYIVLDVRRMRIRPGDWETQIVDAWEYDRQICGNVVTIIPQDPGASGQMATSILCRALAERGIVTEKMRASGKKLDRFRPFSASSQVGSVKFLKGCGNDYENKVVNDNGFVYRELEAFDGLRRSGEHGHDDIPDSMSDAFSFLASKLTIPNFLGSIRQFQQSIGEQKVVSL